MFLITPWSQVRVLALPPSPKKLTLLWHWDQGIFVRDQETEDNPRMANCENRPTQIVATQAADRADLCDVIGRESCRDHVGHSQPP